MADQDRPFDGLKVIDCASFIAAPAAAAVLGDFGARVIKIEPPAGDLYRDLIDAPGMPVGAAENYPWRLTSRNKQSLVLDLKLTAAQQVLHRLVRDSDVFITNLPLPARARLAIDHPTLAELNPRLIYASLTAYGETGAESGKTGFDSTAYWARSGLMDQMRAQHDAPPVRSVPGMGDQPTAMTLFGAIVTALYRRARTGQGAMVSTSLIGNGVWSNAFLVQAHLSGAATPPRMPREQARNPLTNTYRCRDGHWISLVVLNEARQFAPLVAALGCAELANDERFATATARTRHNRALIELFEQCFDREDAAYWRRVLDAAGITFSAITPLAEVTADPQIHAAGVFAGEQAALTLASPFQLAGVAQCEPGPAPRLGEHSRQLLRAAGYADADIDQLRAAGVFGARNQS